jgi:hypothetical protein
LVREKVDARAASKFKQKWFGFSLNIRFDRQWYDPDPEFLFANFNQ